MAMLMVSLRKLRSTACGMPKAHPLPSPACGQEH
jgi:hypothetical protein